ETSRLATPSSNADVVVDAESMRASDRFKTAKNGQVYVGSLYYAGKYPMMDVAAPVLDASGSVAGVIFEKVSLKNLGTIIANGLLGNTGYLYLLDQDGNVMASGKTDITRTSLNLIDGAPQGTVTSGQNTALVRAVLAGKNFLGTDGEARY